MPIKPSQSRNGLKYQTNPEYRARQLERARDRYRNPATPEHKRLAQVRTDLHRLRESLKDRMAHARELAGRIVTLQEEEAYLKECIRWKVRRL